MRVPLFGTGVSSGDPQVTVRRAVNMYFEPRGTTEKAAIIAKPFPGLTTFGTTGATQVRKMASDDNGNIYAVIYDTAYKITSAGSYTSLGTMPTTSGRSSMGIAAGAGLFLFVDGSSSMRLYNPTGPTWSTISPGFSSVGAAWIDGYFVTIKSGTNQFFISTDGSTWTSYASAEASYDYLWGLLATRNELFLFGRSTIEVWTDVGNADFPFQRVNGATSNIGLAADQSACLVAGVPYFVAKSGDGRPYVARMNGYRPERVSTDDIDRILGAVGTYISLSVGFGFMWNGHPMYQLTNTTGGWTYCFDAATGVWSEIGNSAVHTVIVGCEVNAGVYGGGDSGPNIYKYDETAHNLSTRKIVTDHVVSPDMERITCDSVRLDMSTNVNATEKNVALRVSRDGGLSWGSSQSVGIGTTTGPYKKVEWRRLGTARTFTYEFSLPADVDITVQNAIMNAAD